MDFNELTIDELREQRKQATFVPRLTRTSRYVENGLKN